MLVRTAHGNRVVKRTPPGVAEWGNTNPWRFRLAAQHSSSGIQVTNEKVLGLPAIFEGIRMPAQLCAMLDWGVWNLSQPTLPVLNVDSWQAKLIQAPVATNTFNLFQDISAAVDYYANSFTQKIKADGEVVALKPIDPNRVKVNVENGKVTYDIAVSTSKTIKGLTSDDILHVRAFVPDGFVSGVPLFTRFANSLGNNLAVEEFSGSWWKNSGSTSQYISHPDHLSDTQAEQILEVWEETHTGLHNAGRPAFLTGGATLQQLQVTAEDAQLIASREWSVEDIARMVDWPADALNGGKSELNKTEEFLMRLTTLYLMPRVERIKAAFNNDPDLFEGTPLWLDAKFSKLRAADLQFESLYDLQSRQGGIETANEIRARRGLPPRADGDQLLPIPVGAGAAGNEPKPPNNEPNEPAPQE